MKRFAELVRPTIMRFTTTRSTVARSWEVREVLLKIRLQAALHLLKPRIAAPVIKDDLDVLLHGSTPGLISGTGPHRNLNSGVQIFWQSRDQTESAHLVDFDGPAKSDRLMVSQSR